MDVLLLHRTQLNNLGFELMRFFLHSQLLYIVISRTQVTIYYINRIVTCAQHHGQTKTSE